MSTSCRSIFFILNILCFLILQGTFAQISHFDYKRYTDVQDDKMNYRLLSPDYDTIRKYPLVIFLHGSGESGNDNEAQLKWGILFLAFIACKKDTNTYDTGLLTGIDRGECICCGGYLIEINNIHYQFWTIPSDCNIDFKNATYPIAVKVEWKKDSTGCKPNLITVISLKKE